MRGDIMTAVITFIVIAAIWGYCAATQIPEKKRRQQFYMDKAREAAMKGDLEMADRYTEVLSKMR